MSRCVVGGAERVQQAAVVASDAGGDGMADNPLAQAIFHSAESQQTRGSAYHSVQVATKASVLVYGGAFALPTAIGGPSLAEVAIGTNEAGGIHFAVGVDGTSMHGATQFFVRGLEMTRFGAESFAAEAPIRIPVPVLNPGAVLPEAGQTVANCFTGVCSAILRGGLP